MRRGCPEHIARARRVEGVDHGRRHVVRPAVCRIEQQRPAGAERHDDRRAGHRVQRRCGRLRRALPRQLDRLGLVGLDDRPQRHQLRVQRSCRPRVDHDGHALARGPACGRDHDVIRDLEGQEQHAAGRRLEPVECPRHRRSVEGTTGTGCDRDLVLARHVDHDQRHGRGQSRQADTAADVDALHGHARECLVAHRVVADRAQEPRRRHRTGPPRTPGWRSCRPPTW